MGEINKRNSERLSIIMPVYNVESYVEKAICSILNQSYLNWELIIVNDGSRDGSGKICEYYSQKDDRIILVNQKNCGVSEARKKGFEIATGKYITFVDGDDYLDKEFCAFTIEKLNTLNVDWVSVDFVERNGKPFPDNQHINSNDVLNKKDVVCDYFRHKLYTSFMWGKVFKKEIILDAYFHDLAIGEDTCFMFDIFRKTQRAYISSAKLYNYVFRNDSAIHSTAFNLKSFDLLHMLDYIEIFCEDEECEEYKKSLNFKRAKTLRGLYWGTMKISDKKLKKEYNSMIIEYLKKISISELPTKMQLHLCGIRYCPKIYQVLVISTLRNTNKYD